MINENKKQFDFDLDLPGIELPVEDDNTPITELNFTKLTTEELLDFNTDLEIVRACGNCIYFVPTRVKSRSGHCVVAKPVKSNSMVLANISKGAVYPWRDSTMHCKLHRLALVGPNSAANLAKLSKRTFNLTGDLKCKK